jgi:hypothetical protein
LKQSSFFTGFFLGGSAHLHILVVDGVLAFVGCGLGRGLVLVDGRLTFVGCGLSFVAGVLASVGDVFNCNHWSCACLG